MAIFPLVGLLMLLIGLLALVLVGLGLYWVVGWLIGLSITTALFVTGIVFLVFALLGRPLMLLLLARPGQNEPRPARAVETQRIERPDGTVLHVEFFGPADAQPIVLTHGWTANSTDWYYVKLFLAQRFRVIVWDLPGSAKSSLARNGNYSLERMATDLEAVIALAARPVIIAGHSMGGMITLNYCKLFLQELGTRVAGVVLVDTTYINPVYTAPASGLLRAIQKPILVPAMYLMIALSPLVWLQNWLMFFNGMAHIQQRFTSFCGSQTRGQLDHMSFLQTIVPPWVIGKQMLAMFKHDTTDILPQINVPTLVIVGDNDRGCVPKASYYMQAHIPNAQLVEITHSGHVSMMEQNTQVNAAMDTFVTGVARQVQPVA